MNNMTITAGDLTQAQVDAIVNAANVRLLAGGGVCGALHKAAGPELKQACDQIQSINGFKCPTGEARITTAGNLPAKYVIHTVGPVYRISQNPAEELASAYRSSLRLALDNCCSSIAFPAISCGTYGYPLQEAAKVAIQTCSEPEFSSLDIYLYHYSRPTYEAWQQQMAKLEVHD